MTTPTFPFSFDFLSAQKLPAGTKESAQEIWLAGLGAFAKAQKDGEKAFQTLVQDGVSMQKKGQEEAKKKLAEATEKMSVLAEDMAVKATGGWGKLENIFEDRVSRALKQLGVPSRDEIEALREEVAQLRALLKAQSTPKSAATAKPKTAAKSAPSKKTTAAKVKPASKSTTKSKSSGQSVA